MKLVYVVMLMFFSSISISSQNDSLKSNFALSFGIEDIFKLNSFDLDIGFKMIISETNELRIFLAPRFSDHINENEFDVNNGHSKNSNLDFSLGVRSDYLWKIIRNDDFSLFGGPGLIFSIGTKTLESKNNDLGNYILVSESTMDSKSIGFRGILGVEWKVNNWIGIHSEYQYLGSYHWINSETKNHHNENQRTKSISKNYGVSFGSNVLFGLSIYL